MCGRYRQARDRAALERLVLLAPGDRAPRRRAAAPHVVAMGDAIWPEREDEAPDAIT